MVSCLFFQALGNRTRGIVPRKVQVRYWQIYLHWLSIGMGCPVSGGITIFGSIQKKMRGGTLCYDLVGIVVFAQCLDLMVLDIFSNLNYSVTLLPGKQYCSKETQPNDLLYWPRQRWQIEGSFPFPVNDSALVR